ncbi:MAG: twin-arginine translocase TatA/TatE family subunit [Bryobacteraceae bacterium]|nr:twin-arginine translocase TatA/TatE family subunit [Bryobacteraceae bacterium]
MGPLGWQETVFIFILALLIFGPRKLPELGKTLGKAMTEFRRASAELKSTWNREMAAIERESESIKEATRQVNNEISSSYHSGGYDEYDYGYNYESSSYSGSGTGSPESSNGSAANESSTVSASATQGAESTEEPQVAEQNQNGAEPSDSKPVAS